MSKTPKRAAFYHDLAVMLEAGLPILRSLDTVTKGLEGNFQKAFSDVRQSVSKGESLSESMAVHKKVFDKLDIIMVETAELSGSLPECFKSLASWYEFKNRLRRIMIKGLILPMFVLNIAAFVAPMPSLILGKLTFFEYFLAVFRVLAGFYMFFFSFFVIYKLMRSNRLLNKILDTILLRIPVLGNALLQLSICRFCRSFNMLFKAGVPISQSLAKATELTGNSAVSGLFVGGAKNAAKGNMPSQGFSTRLPSEYLSLWLIGEESGELEKAVDKIAELSGDKAYLLLSLCAIWVPMIIYAIICLWIIKQIFILYASVYSMSSLQGGY
ncbi:MAG: type II secretion system F family protein [Sedimentisphaerales bacterium]|nr:type II secretion system F family protein [Sedimentisphaerales bacterium]